MWHSIPSSGDGGNEFAVKRFKNAGTDIEVRTEIHFQTMKENVLNKIILASSNRMECGSMKGT